MDTRVRDWTKLGAVIRDARKARGLSQHALAGRAGVSRSWLARLESGHRGAELEPLFRLLGALGMSLALHDPSRSDGGHAPSHADPTDGEPASSSQLDAVDRHGDEPADQRSDKPLRSVVAKHRASATGRRQAWQDAIRNAAQLSSDRDGDASAGGRDDE